jgi:hypothetical protein
MTTVIITFIIMLIVVAVMAIGVMMGKKPLKGSCGGLSALGMKESCDICGGNDDACDKEQARQKLSEQNSSSSLAYEVTDKNKRA